MLRVCTLASGSRGNSVFVGTRSGGLLVDAGLSFSETKRKLGEIDVKISDIRAVIITHEHSDHTRYLEDFANVGIAVFVHEELSAAAGLENDRIASFSGVFTIGDIEITPFDVPHDCVSNSGFIFSDGNKRAALATDIGHITKAMTEALAGCDCYILESNHDVEMLKNGQYPRKVKARIAGELGHLSNDENNTLIAKIITNRAKNIVLAHLSEENNIPELAFNCLCSKLKSIGLTEGKDIRVDIALQYKMGKLVVV
jgi:phosphoribosyl 1,2-cyclic phosphodiesterase